MDINLARSLITALLFIIFIGIVLWAWSKGKRKDFEEAARLPLDDDLPEERTDRKGRGE
ncbi:MAG: cbb3-type cytochrome c oxidase subunit 3 [Burkholderiales bacterium]|jgi:cytochrome c oxidase cbb3-type subunit 4|nr:cbb3-type cytochrome c oxidase subunit 3 [Rubrivivax sp.]MDP2396749.1 cbb3-type cytochrome c oxidase subunit 3 [Burkholderiales bacterium]